MPKLKPTHISPTPDEDADINKGIEADPDAPELDEAWFERAKPASEVDPELVQHSQEEREKVPAE
ncbi:MAG: hypothetical protein F4Y50_01845 [Dehalococcoidia bacterium]|nr:hypothetical protein [Dehalococcoidia bacterium]